MYLDLCIDLIRVDGENEALCKKAAAVIELLARENIELEKENAYLEMAYKQEVTRSALKDMIRNGQIRSFISEDIHKHFLGVRSNGSQLFRSAAEGTATGGTEDAGTEEP